MNRLLGKDDWIVITALCLFAAGIFLGWYVGYSERCPASAQAQERSRLCPPATELVPPNREAFREVTEQTRLLDAKTEELSRWVGQHYTECPRCREKAIQEDGLASVRNYEEIFERSKALLEARE